MSLTATRQVHAVLGGVAKMQINKPQTNKAATKNKTAQLWMSKPKTIIERFTKSKNSAGISFTRTKYYFHKKPPNGLRFSGEAGDSNTTLGANTINEHMTINAADSSLIHCKRVLGGWTDMIIINDDDKISFTFIR